MTETFDILMDTGKCAELFREIRWRDGVFCPRCDGRSFRNVSTRHDGIKRYHCNHCGRSFTDITYTIVEGSHLPISKWMMAAYLMKFNLSDRQLSFEIGVEENTARRV